MNMGRTKDLLPENWHEHQEQMNLHWMEEEYFGNLAEQNRKKNPYDKFHKQEKKAHIKGQKPHIIARQQSIKTEQRMPPLKRGGV